MVAHLVEFRNRPVALLLDLDDVPAELGLHRIGELAGFELERRLGEFRHHLILGEIAEIAAVGGTRVLRLLLGDRGEVAALLELGEDRLRLVLGIDQNVAGVDLLLARHLLNGLIIELMQRALRDRCLAFLLQHRFHQQLAARIGEPALEILAVLHFLGFGRLRHQDHVGQIFGEILVPGLPGHRQVGSDVLFGDGEVARPDFRTVDARDHRIAVGRANRSRERELHQQSGRQAAEPAAPIAPIRRRRMRQAAGNQRKRGHGVFLFQQRPPVRRRNRGGHSRKRFALAMAAGAAKSRFSFTFRRGGGD